MLGGGVVVLVAVLLWLVYLLPSLHSRHQFNAAERNAVRLNQAIRVLAETSETPEEVRVELTARTALAQQRLAKRVQAEQEQAKLAELRASLDAARNAPAARRARARRRARLIASTLMLTGLGLVGWGVWQTVQVGVQTMLWVGASVVLASFIVLQRMATVAARAAVREVAAPQVAVSRSEAVMQDLALPGDVAPVAAWTPRPLPRPLAAEAGSRAALELDVVDAHAALRAAAREEAMRERIERENPAPVPITSAPAASAPTAPAPERISPYASMGVVDDAEIEEHVRQLLARRVAV